MTQWLNWSKKKCEGLFPSLSRFLGLNCMKSLRLLCHLLFDHFQFALIHGPNIRGSYAILFFTASDFTSITSHIHNWVLFLLWLHLFILFELFLHCSPVAYWAPTDLRNSSFRVRSFCLFILFRGFSRQENWSGLPFPSPVDHVLSEFSTMTIGLGWPYTVWLIDSLS